MAGKQKKRLSSAVTISIIIIAGLVLYKCYPQTQERDYPQIEKSGILHIVTNMDPIGYFASSDTIAGYNHDMLAALQKYTNIKFEISLENSLDESFKGLQSGKYDLIARNIAINANLRESYSFVTPITYNKLVLVQRKPEYNEGKAPIRNHLELGNKTLHIPLNSPNKIRIDNLAHEIGDSIHISEDSLYEDEQIVMMVASGDVDYAVCDIQTTQLLSAKFPEIDIATDIGFTHLEGWAVRNQSPALRDSLNSWIERFKQTDEYKLIQKKYYTK